MGGPYPLLDISCMREIGTSVDTYNRENGLDQQIPEMEGGTHNPLYDSIAAAVAYRDVKEMELERDQMIQEFLKDADDALNDSTENR